MKYFTHVFGLFPALWKPEWYFQETSTEHLRDRSLFGIGTLLLVVTLLVFLSALINTDGPREIQEDFLRRLQIDPALLPAAGVPYGTLSFGVYWLVLVAVIGPLRYFMLRILGDANPSLSVSYYISIHSAVPMILMGGIMAVANNLFPPGLPAPGETGLARLLFTTGLAGAGLIWELFVATKGFRVRFAQNTGRAILTALAPWAVLFQILAFT